MNNMFKIIFFTLVFTLSLMSSVSSQCLSGNCDDGQGYYLMRNGDRYLGQSVYSKSHGMGAYLYKAGAIYFGEWKEGKRHGRGYFYSITDKELFVGYFQFGKLQKGTYLYSNGDIYEGEYKNNLRSFGSYYSCDSGVYIGEWQNNKRHGQGKFIKSNGEKQIGTFNQNAFVEGETITTELDPNLKFSKTIKPKAKSRYTGQVNAQGDFYGFGVWTSVRGKIGTAGATELSLGDFKRNVLHGTGVQVLDGGNSILLGEFRNNNFVEGLYIENNYDKRIFIGQIDTTSYKFIGSGCLVFQDKNESYYGQFSQGEYHGQGSYFWPSGEKYNGTFSNSNKVQGIESFPDGEVRRVKFNSYGIAEVLEQISLPYSKRKQTVDYSKLDPIYTSKVKTCLVCAGIGKIWKPLYSKVVNQGQNCVSMVMPGDANWMRGYDYYVKEDCERSTYAVDVGKYKTCNICGGDGIK